MYSVNITFNDKDKFGINDSIIYWDSDTVIKTNSERQHGQLQWHAAYRCY